jgi:hypothetical protein
MIPTLSARQGVGVHALAPSRSHGSVADQSTEPRSAPNLQPRNTSDQESEVSQ